MNMFISSHWAFLVPGLTLEESTDINTLQRELNRVENLIKDLSVNKKSKFIERDQKEDLKVGSKYFWPILYSFSDYSIF